MTAASEVTQTVAIFKGLPRSLRWTLKWTLGIQLVAQEVAQEVAQAVAQPVARFKGDPTGFPNFGLL